MKLIVQVLIVLIAHTALAREVVPLSSLPIEATSQGWGSPKRDRSVDGNPLRIAGIEYKSGLGTHSDSRLILNLNGDSIQFSAKCGVDDEVSDDRASVVFQVWADKKLVWESGVMKLGDAAKAVSVPLDGVQRLELRVTDGGDGINYDHANWVDAVIAVQGARPTVFELNRKPYILTPKPGPQPKINGARVFGARPGNPFLYTIAATGERPMTFACEKLPPGLSLDAQTGQITGTLNDRGTHTVTLIARNTLGESRRDLRIVVGDTIALTPPMGWNSWNCWAESISDDKVRAAADAMVSSGLINHGWTYVNIDDCWEIKPGSKDPMVSGEPRDKNGFINTNGKFPDMKSLADYVHSRGLKIGLYSSPGPLTCAGYTASYQFEENDARRWAEWGFDYIKYDWCSYGNVVKDIKPLKREDYEKPYRVMRDALDKQKRDIVYSLCQYGMGNVWEWGAAVGGNCWRTTGDITDTWQSMSSIGFGQAGHEKFAGPGNWNDPDMLVVGLVGWSANLHPTKLTPDEQYTHISLWCLLSSPLLIGCDMTRMDEFTTSLLTNDEVLDVNQDPLGKQASRVSVSGELEIWAKDLEDGSKAVGLFNRSLDDTTVAANWSDMGISGEKTVRDLWRQKDLGRFVGKFETTVPAHGVVLVKIGG